MYVALQDKVRLSKTQLLEIYKVKDSEQFSEIYRCLMDVIDNYDIRDNIHRLAAFIAQVGYESGKFRYLEELVSGKEYEGRTDLGNIHKGDGPRYKGRGLIQITGRYNYEQISKDLDVDFVANPKMLATPYYAVVSALWFWEKKELNKLADEERFREITKKINGGYNGHEKRVQLYSSALYVLSR